MRVGSLKETIPRPPEEDEPPNSVMYREPGNDIGEAVAWTIEKEVEKFTSGEREGKDIPRLPSEDKPSDYLKYDKPNDQIDEEMAWFEQLVLDSNNVHRKKGIPRSTLKDQPPGAFKYREPVNRIRKAIAFAIEKEIDNLSSVVEKRMELKMAGTVEKEVNKKVSSIMLVQAKQFCARTSLHGLAYIAEDDRPWWERILWVISMFSFLLFGAYVMKPIYDKWQFVPTITSVETTNFPIWQVYFPAVTICSNNRIEMTRLESLLEKEPWLSLRKNYSDFDANLKLALISTLTFDTNSTIYNESIHSLNVTRKIMNDLKDNLTFLAQKAMPSCRNMILYCEWQGQVVECGDFFGVRKTDNGFCCSFNTLKLAEQFRSNENIDVTSEDEYAYDDEYDINWYDSYWSTLTTGCKYFYWISDYWCDYENNNANCNYDGGDCCDPSSYFPYGYNEQFCVKNKSYLFGEECVFEGTDHDHHCNPMPYPKCPFTKLVGDGSCDNITNNVFCGFDGGDCCYSSNNCVDEDNLITTAEGCPYPGANKIGDGVCDDINNHPACDYDGGDCCNPNADHSWSACQKCGCLDPTTGPVQECYRPLWVGDGFCDDYTNHVGCKFDGGDCCMENPDKTYCHKCECITEEEPEEEIIVPNVTIIAEEPTRLKRTNVANSNLGLTILLYPNAKEYHYSSDNNFVGFKVLVHSPYDFPEVAGKGFVVGEGAEAFIAVGAQYTTTSDEVLSLPLEKRKCLSHGEDLKMYPEVKLEAFQNYSRKACLLECQARDLMSVCGCLPYFFPDFGSIWGKNTACFLNGLQCLANTTDQKKALQPEGQSDTEGYIQSAPICNCPNDCDETTYSQEMSFFTIKEGSEFFENLKKAPNILYKKQEIMNKFKSDVLQQKIADEMQRIINSSSIVHIYFKEIGIVKYSRDQVYTVMDVIAAFGGIIGLCCGFSMISIVEIIYWFSIRLYTDHYEKWPSNGKKARMSKNLIGFLKQKEIFFCNGHPLLKWLVYVLIIFLFLLVLVTCILVPIYAALQARETKTENTMEVSTTTTSTTTTTTTTITSTFTSTTIATSTAITTSTTIITSTTFTTSTTTVIRNNSVGFEEAYKDGKIFVATGYSSSGDSSRHGEVIDVLGGSTCTQYGDFPFDVFGATAAILPGMWSPLICGGETNSGEQLDKCYILGQDTPYVTMIETRVRAASIALNHTHILVTGGYDGPFYSNTSEIISMVDGTTEYGPNLPHRVRSHCFIRVSGNRAMLIGGYQDDNPLPSVYYLNLDTFEWAQGPDLNTARTSAACGTYTSNEQTYVVVAGGYTWYAISSTEVMSVTYGTYWMQGPELPFGISDIAMVTNPQGNGVIALAGWSDPWPSFRDELFVLSCNGSSCSNWTQLESKLSMPRFGCIALSVPDDIC